MSSNIEIGKLKENIYYRNPLSQKKFEKLCDSIKQYGIIEPLTVEPDLKKVKGNYIIVDGIQRFRAAKFLGLSHVPCEVI